MAILVKDNFKLDNLDKDTYGLVKVTGNHQDLDKDCRSPKYRHHPLLHRLTGHNNLPGFCDEDIDFTPHVELPLKINTGFQGKLALSRLRGFIKTLTRFESAARDSTITLSRTRGFHDNLVKDNEIPRQP